jgi:hypothetical protein
VAGLVEVGKYESRIPSEARDMATKISAVLLTIGAFLAGTALVAKPVAEGADGPLTYYKDVLPIV